MRAFALGFFLLGGVVSAEAAPTPMDAIGRVGHFVICKNAPAVRTLRVYEGSEFGCRATYTKSGNEQVVGSSRQKQQCRTIVDGIRKTLESSNWKCRDAGAVAVLRSSAVLETAAQELDVQNVTQEKAAVPKTVSAPTAAAAPKPSTTR